MALPSQALGSGSSLLHKTDARAKLVAAFALTIAIALCTTLHAALLGLVLGLLLIPFSGLELPALTKRLLTINGLTLFLWLVLPFTYPIGSNGSIQLQGISLSLAGIHLASLITVKTNSIFLIFCALVGTTEVPALGQALSWLRIPRKFCWMLVFTYRYLFVIHDEYQRMARAASLRGFVPSSTMHTYSTYANLIGMVLVRSMDRAQRVGKAMLLRGFDGQFRGLEPAAFGTMDAVLLVLLLAKAAGIALYDNNFIFSGSLLQEWLSI